MSSSRKPRPDPLSAKGIASILQRLDGNKPIRRTLSDWGRLHIDRQLPFLCIHRKPADRDDSLTGRLLVAEASYLLVSGERKYHKRSVDLVRAIAGAMAERFGAFLIVEVWAEDRGAPVETESTPQPAFTVRQRRQDEFSSTLQTLRRRLGAIRWQRQRAKVSAITSTAIAPPNMPQILTAQEARELGCFVVGVGVQPVYLDPDSREPYPLLYRSIKRQLGRSLDQTFYEFAREHTTLRPAHYYALGRRAMVKAVWEADRRLAEVASSFDLLYQVTPVNTEDAWEAFRKSRLEKAPHFLYRPSPVDPGDIKRLLFSTHIERVEDPTLMNMFLEKQLELERELTMLQDLGTPRFLYGSLQLHGPVTEDLLAVARDILRDSPSRASAKERKVPAEEFAKRARAEIKLYADRYAGFTGTAVIDPEMYTGLMVSRGRLLIGRALSVPESRVAALFQHEIGTHLLTYFNGKAQPFKMLYTGMPGYDELQEGLAVLSEYFVGGLSVARIRVLAARVVAAHGLLAGASFVDVYRLLHREFGFTQRTAFTVTMRVFRGGGLVKDAIYLRGLQGVLQLIADGEEFDLLFTGKFGSDHLPVVRELLHRKILVTPPVHPHYMGLPEYTERLAKLRQGVSVLELVH